MKLEGEFNQFHMDCHKNASITLFWSNPTSHADWP